MTRAGGSAARSAAQQPERCTPALTGGVETTDSAKVDWCTVTWQPDPDEHIPATALSLLHQVVGEVQGTSCPGMLGYEHGVRFFVVVRDTAISVGRVDYGGPWHKGRARLDLSGAGCSVITDWHTVRTWVAQQFDAKLTRVDLAVDCLFGEYTVDQAVEWYKAGEFKAATSGRQPRHSTPGDWLDPYYGRTLEIGRRENGKMCRVYEKGRQLGDPSSMWTRFEVEIRNNDRDLPFDILTDCGKYFTGAYRCLERVLAVAAERIKLKRREEEIVIERLSVHARSSYGQLIDVLRLRVSASEILDVLSRPGIPGRLSKSSLSAFNSADSPAAYLKEKCHEAANSRV